MPAFYQRPASVDDIIDHIVARVLDQFGLEQPGTSRLARAAAARTSPWRTSADDAEGGSRAAAV